MPTAVRLKTAGAAALKEWAVTVRALEQGRQLLLLRKGGILEARQGFRLEHRCFFLLPTYEHQRPELIRPEHRHLLDDALAAWPFHPWQVLLPCWAEVVAAHPVTTEDALARLLPFHVWTADYARERLHWNPGHPLYALVVRVYRLATPVSLPLAGGYAGCRSWLTLEPGGMAELGEPSLDDAAFATRARAI
ncbi:MAG: DUF1802 family protein [Clostridia bacterium]|nr:DUF1802 family protein [Clostridia bacterium]